MVKPAQHIELIQPYEITSQDVWSDFAPDKLLKLDWNEAPRNFPFYDKALREMADNRGMTAWYPDFLSIKLNAKLADFLDVSAANILTFPGSDVALENVCRAYLGIGDKVSILCPTYENFFVFAAQTGAVLSFVNLNEPFEIDWQWLEAKLLIKQKPKVVYLVNPNNPTGIILNRSKLIKLINSYPETLFIIDEAYIEFTNEQSLCSLAQEIDNLVVTRTFSKCFGMAGVRLGYMVANLSIIQTVNKIRNGKSITMIAQNLGIVALENLRYFDLWVNEVRFAKEIFESWCAKNKIKYFPSHGNFVMFCVNNVNDICSKLRADGVYVRDRGKIVSGAIRVTIGSIKDTELLIKALDQAIR
ncbi:histidinol-phosphate aminotransferase family protein [Alphaproteobacteria bacterium]|nr:histidinol-phosphate aminotransferase family protein [Alphaproteobacteria bacterium]